MTADDPPSVSAETRKSLDQAGKVAKAIDDAITLAVPAVVDLQVAASPAGDVVFSGVVASLEAKARAEEAARKIPGVKRLINGLTVVAP